MNKVWISIVAFAFCSAGSLDYDRVYKGTYVWGAEVDVFAPCNADDEYWASYNWAGRKLVEFYKGKVKKPYKPIYVEFRGHMLDEEVDGFAENYDGLIHVSEVKVIEVEIPDECVTAHNKRVVHDDKSEKLENVDTIKSRIEAELIVGDPRGKVERFLASSTWIYTYDRFQSRFQARPKDGASECKNSSLLLRLFYDCGIQIYINLDDKGFYKGSSVEQVYSGL